MFVLLRLRNGNLQELAEIVGPFDKEADVWQWADKHWPTLNGQELYLQVLSSPNIPTEGV